MSRASVAQRSLLRKGSLSRKAIESRFFPLLVYMWPTSARIQPGNWHTSLPVLNGKRRGTEMGMKNSSFVEQQLTSIMQVKEQKGLRSSIQAVLSVTMLAYFFSCLQKERSTECDSGREYGQCRARLNKSPSGHSACWHTSIPYVVGGVVPFGKKAAEHGGN